MDKIRNIINFLCFTLCFLILFNSSADAISSKRGMMVGPSLSFADLDALDSWNVNVVRWQFTKLANRDSENITEYRSWLQSVLNNVIALAPTMQEKGIKVIVDLHTPPGGFRMDPNGFAVHKIFENSTLRNEFLNSWLTITQQLKPYSAILVQGYDLLNEPAVGLINGSVTKALTDNWRYLAIDTMTMIKNIDDVRIFIEPGYGTPENLVRLTPITGFSKLVYSVHHYFPLSYTHQGVGSFPDNITYPGKEVIQASLDKAIAYETRHNVKIYIGEFSVNKDAPGAGKFLRDSIDIFEQNSWSWTYHAFREASVWDVEQGNPNRKSILLSYFALNP